MANNLGVSTGSDATVKTTDNAGVHTTHHNVDTIAAGENHIGEVGAAGAVLDVTLSLDTAAYADGDLLAATQEIANAVRVAAGRGILQSVHVLDEDDQGVGFDLIFLDANNSLGSENSAPSVSDADARAIIGKVSIYTGDYSDLGGCRVATKTGIGLVLKAAAASTALWVGAVVRGGAPTYTASGIRLKLGMLWD